MNLILMKNGYLPVVIKNENREDYYRALLEADKGNLSNFTNLVASEEKRSLQLILSTIRD